jgi:hypothetical protein
VHGVHCCGGIKRGGGEITDEGGEERVWTVVRWITVNGEMERVGDCCQEMIGMN